MPQGFWENLQIALKAYGGLSNQFRLVETETGNPMPWPTTDPTAVVGSVLSAELTPLALDQPYVFGQGFMHSWTVYTPPFLASLQTVQDSAFDVEQFATDRIGEAIGRKKASLAYSGTGSGQHQGLSVVLSAKGAVTPGNGSGGYYALGAATAVKVFSVSNTELVANTLAPATLVAMAECIDPAYYTGAGGS